MTAKTSHNLTARGYATARLFTALSGDLGRLPPVQRITAYRILEALVRAVDNSCLTEEARLYVVRIEEGHSATRAKKVEAGARLEAQAECIDALVRAMKDQGLGHLLQPTALGHTSASAALARLEELERGP